MKRRLIIAFVFLLLGAVINVAVAWTFALYVKTYKFQSYDALDESHIAWWREHVPPTWKDTPGAVSFTPAIGADSYFYTEFAESDFAVNRTLGNNVIRHFAGYPMRSMEGAGYFDRQRRIGWTVAWLHIERFWFIPYGKLPLHVRWPQTIANAAFYAVLLAVAYRFGVSRLRAYRRKKHRCTNCNYDLSGASHEKCPECGAAINANAPTEPGRPE